MTHVSAFDDVVTALLTTLGSALPVPVLDGLEDESAALPDFVIIGDDGSPSSTSGRAGSYTQSWSTYEMGSRDEIGTVTCCVISQSGEDDMPARRASSKATLDAIEAVLRASDNLSGIVAAGFIQTVEVYYIRNASGTMVRRVFTYQYKEFQD